ncbi:MAG TPA: helical backbone metal receptor [Lautropia sp.]|nr:helical backbone metal receptor [Lautropia sp.]
MATAQPVSVTDDQGRRVALQTAAKRAITLSPALTELVFAAGGGERLVGAVEHSDYPAAAAGLPRVGDALSLQMEKILSLRPDLILAWQRGNNPRQLERLAELGVPIYYSDIEELDGVATTLERLGVLFGTPTQAAARDFRQRLARLGPADASSPPSPTPAPDAVSSAPAEHSFKASQEPVRVLYQVWAQPLMTINGRHVITDLIERCGGINVFSSQPLLVPQIGIEAAVAAAPEAIIASASRRAAASDRSLEHWRRYASIPAVANGFLFLIDADAISRATPRMLDAGEAICSHLDKVRQSR